MRRPSLRVIGLFTAFVAFGLVVSTPDLSQSKPKETYDALNLFGEVFERVRAQYVDDVSDEELIEAAVNGMLSSLDPHSSYLNPKNFKDMQVQTKGEFGGLGIEVTMQDGLVRVVSPIDDTPAHRAGLQPGDLVSHLDGERVLGLTLSQAVERMRGKPNTDITLTIRRNGEQPFDVTITRAVIKIRSVRSRLEGSIAYVRITSFNQQTDPGLRDAISDLAKEAPEGKLKGIVLDLRNNPGGLLNQAIAVSDAFLERGEIVSTRGRDKDDAQRVNASPGDITGGLPVVVLINGGSASASEIVAGALQDHRRALIMGTKSFGKGSVQTIQPIGGKGAIRLTTARYYTPSGRSIQAKGIEPDIEVLPAKVETVDVSRRRREADLRGALANPNRDDEAETEGKAADDKPGSEEQKDGEATEPDGKASPDEAADEPAAAPKPVDYQLSRALDLLRGLALFNERKGG